MKRFLMPGLVGIAALCLSGCEKEKIEAPEPIRPVLSVVVQPQDTRQAQLVGTVSPRVSTQLSFRLLGMIVSRAVDVGDLVSKGKTIASLDPAQLQLQVQGARASLASALAQAANASASEERQRLLLESKNTPQATYDAARQARDSANAGVEQAQAALTKAEEQLGYAQLFCDFDGVVTAVGAEVGQVVSPGQMIVTVARADQRDAVIDMPAQLVAGLKLGDSFTVSLQTASSITSVAKVREIAPQADNATRTRRVRLELVDAPAPFRLGATITAVQDAPEATSIEIPSSALLEDGGKTSVWVVEGDVVQSREVKVSEKSATAAVIASGLKPGDRVVTAGVHSLKPGQKIKADWEPVQ